MHLIIFFVSAIIIHTAAQSSKCDEDQWRCHDDKCIEKGKMCDGILDCPDGSDETFVHCRGNICPNDKFQCLYGGCVEKNVTCDGKFDCIDQSDEKLPKCRGELNYDECFDSVLADIAELEEKHTVVLKSSTTKCAENEITCKNGDQPVGMLKCNGIKECKDGSDETMEECIAAKPSCIGDFFRCAYGACIPAGKLCNGESDCVDGSDEIDELCGVEKRAEACILPEFPANGYYLANQPFAYPGRVFEKVRLYYNCNPGFNLFGTTSAGCISGTWWSLVTERDEHLKLLSPYPDLSVFEMEFLNPPTPMCVPQCVLPKQDSVEYWCLPTEKDNSTELKQCDKLVNTGTVVLPKCRSSFYATVVLHNMTCQHGSWNYIARCSECGLITTEKDGLVIGGQHAYRGEMPWHAGIYTKTKKPFLQVCGGSLISNKVVLSAAHCFWKDTQKKLPAEQFAVAVGKIYRPWNETHDVDAQESDVKSIEMTPRFQGAETNFQEDIALVILKKRIRFRSFVRPICLDFDYNFEQKQLATGSSGKVAGWGLTAPHGRESPILKVVELPYIDILKCYVESPASFREYITSDKICAGFKNGTALCRETAVVASHFLLTNQELNATSSVE